VPGTEWTRSPSEAQCHPQRVSKRLATYCYAQIAGNMQTHTCTHASHMQSWPTVTVKEWYDAAATAEYRSTTNRAAVGSWVRPVEVHPAVVLYLLSGLSAFRLSPFYEQSRNRSLCFETSPAGSSGHCRTAETSHQSHNTST